MKKIIGIIIALACLTFGAKAENRIGPFVTGMISSGDKSGGAFGVGLKYEWLLNQNLGIDVHAGYLTDSDVGLIPLEFGPIVVIPLNPLSLTFGAGGLYGVPTDSKYSAALGFYGLAGVRGPLSEGMEWFAEAQYASVKGDDKTTTTYFKDRYGYGFRTTSEPHLDFRGIGLNLGILWKF